MDDTTNTTIEESEESITESTIKPTKKDKKDRDSILTVAQKTTETKFKINKSKSIMLSSTQKTKTNKIINKAKKKQILGQCKDAVTEMNITDKEKVTETNVNNRLNNYISAYTLASPTKTVQEKKSSSIKEQESFLHLPTMEEIHNKIITTNNTSPRLLTRRPSYSEEMGIVPGEFFQHPRKIVPMKTIIKQMRQKENNDVEMENQFDSLSESEHEEQQTGGAKRKRPLGS